MAAHRTFACVALLLACLPGFAGAAEGARLFSAEKEAAAPPPPSRGLLGEAAGRAGELRGGGPALGGAAPPGELRSRIAEIDLGQLEAVRLGARRMRPHRLRLNLFADAQFEAVFERSAPTASGYVLTGRIEGEPLGTVVLAVNGEWVAGTVWSPAGRYAVRPLGGGVAEVRQLDPSALGRCGVGADAAEGSTGLSPEAGPPGVRRPPTGAASAKSASVSEAFPPDDGGVIDLLVVYPSFARRSMGGHHAMRALIDSDVALANEAYRGGGAMQRLNLVAAVEAKRTPLERRREGMIDTIRHASNPSSGYMDEVSRLRDAYAADLVLVHWGNLQSGGTLGLAGQLDSLLPKDGTEFGFSVSNSRAFAHELGHNMGLNHARRDDRVKSNLPFPYSYGYLHEFDPPLGELEYFATIMTVGVSSNIPRFSNPRQRYPDESGAPMGVSGDEPSQSDDGPADAVRSLNGTRRVVANIRRSASRCSYELSAAQRGLPASGGEFRIGVRAGSGCAWGAWSNDDFVSVPDGAGGVGDGEVVFRVSANGGWERDVAVFVAGEVYLAEQATAKERRSPPPVCGRFPGVRDAITAASGKEACGEVTASDLASIRVLDLSCALYCRSVEGGTLPIGSLDGLTGLASLDLSSNYDRLTALEPGLFDGLTKLTALNLEYNGLRALRAGGFDGLPNLVELKLRDNPRLTTLEPGAFRGLSYVEELNFRGTGLTALLADAFNGLSNLFSLDFGLQFSGASCGHPDGECIPEPVPLARVEPGAFRGLSKLDTLNLFGNSLTALQPGVFDGLPNLRYLVVGGNEGLTVLAPGVFDGLSDLRYLFLHANGLATLPPGVFDGLAELDVLELRGNKLRTLEPGAFHGLAALRELILGENQLRTLEPRVFEGLTRLELVYLAGNGLRTLKPGLFDGLTALRTVALGGNELTTLDPDLFRGMFYLKRLNLAANHLTGLPPGLFEGLSSLNKLDLRSNPGSPFAFAPELVRHPGTGSAAADAVRISAEIVQGAPFDLRVPLSVAGGSLSVEEVLIPGGAVRGAPVSVVPQSGGPTTVLAAAPDLPSPSLCRHPGFWASHSDPCLYGLKTSSGAPLVLYGLPDQTLAPAGAVRFDLRSAFPGFGEGTSYAVELSDSAVVEGTIREGLLIVAAIGGGEVVVMVTARDSNGRRGARRFSVRVPAAPEVVGEIADLALGVGDSAEVALSGVFRDPEGGALAYAAESSNLEVAAAAFVDGVVVVTGRGDGTAMVTVTATAPDGQSAALTFRVTVEQAVSSYWGGWRSVLLRPPPADEDNGS